MKKVSLAVVSCIFALLLPLTFTSRAANLYWSGAGTVAGGAGTWDTSSTTHWSTASAGPFNVAWPNTTSDTATFLGSATYIVTLGNNVTANKITNSSGVTVSINPVSNATNITFGGTSPVIECTANSKLALGVPLKGSSVTLTKTGAGWMQLNNNAQTIGKYVINGGVISTANTNKWGTATTAADTITMNNGGGWGTDTTSQTVDTRLGFTMGTGGGSFGHLSSGFTTTIGSKITGSGGVSFGGAGVAANGYNNSGGIIVLNNTANDWSGATTNVTGTLQLGASEVLPNTTTLFVSGGTVALNGFNETVTALNLSGGTISGSGILTVTGAATLSGGTLASSNTANAITATGTCAVSGVIGGATSVRMNGAASTSVLTLSGVNTYSGDTTNQTGWISISGSASPFGNGTLRFTGGNLIVTANRAVGNTLQTPVEMTSSVTVSNAASTAGTQILIRNGGAWTMSGGTLTIRNTNSATGPFDL
jgi:hypothetical protein